jgi:Winged helix-turn-helix domain (DUF2582)
MHEEIGNAAGSIWHALDGKSALTLAQLKKEVKGESPLFDWAIGWLAREDKIAITREKRSFRVALKDTQTKTASG